MSDLITINADGLEEAIRCAICENQIKSERGCDGSCRYDEKLFKRIIEAVNGCIEEQKRPIGKEEIALNIACDLLIGSVLYGYDFDRIFDEIMERDGCVTSNNIKEFILDHVEELGKEYFVRGEAE